MNYNFHKINLKHFNKEPLLRNTKTLSSFRAFWKEYSSLRQNERNIIIHEGGYKSKLIESIEEFTLHSDSIIIDNEFFNEWFNSKKDEHLKLLKEEISNEITSVFTHVERVTESLVENMISKHNKY